VCVCVYMCVYVYVCMCLRLCACVSVCLCACVCLRELVCGATLGHRRTPLPTVCFIQLVNKQHDSRRMHFAASGDPYFSSLVGTSWGLWPPCRSPTYERSKGGARLCPDAPRWPHTPTPKSRVQDVQIPKKDSEGEAGSWASTRFHMDPTPPAYPAIAKTM
jgi:hypothetical protein